MRTTVFEWERAVRVSRGAVTEELGAGRHRVPSGDELVRVDLRPRNTVLTGQEVPTSDGLLVRVSVVLRWQVTNATAFVRASAQPVEDIHLAAQLGLRDAVLARAHDVLDAEREGVAERVRVLAAARAAEFGVQVIEVAVRDVVLPVELRRAAVAELAARKEGKAALERARSESAALRSLLNVAELAEKHPALLQLRTLQAASQPGATVVLERGR